MSDIPSYRGAMHRQYGQAPAKLDTLEERLGPIYEDARDEKLGFTEAERTEFANLFNGQFYWLVKDIIADAEVAIRRKEELGSHARIRAERVREAWAVLKRAILDDNAYVAACAAMALGVAAEKDMHEPLVMAMGMSAELSPKEWAKIFGHSERTFVRKCQGGNLEHVRLHEKSYRIALLHLDDEQRDRYRKAIAQRRL